jgi:hypothetical protein
MMARCPLRRGQALAGNHRVSPIDADSTAFVSNSQLASNCKTTFMSHHHHHNSRNRCLNTTADRRQISTIIMKITTIISVSCRHCRIGAAIINCSILYFI